MIKKTIPESLHHLIPLVEKWGIEDDGYRDEAIYKATYEQLNEIANSISDNDSTELDKWFCDPVELSSPSNEYLKFSAYFMAFEYAKSILENRQEK